MLLQVGVKILLKNSEGKFLLLKRNPEAYQGMTTWDIVGGRIEPGSALMENLKREVKEETGLELLGEVKLVAAQDILKPDKHVVRLTYTGVLEGEPKLNDEHVEAKWFTAAEMKALSNDLDFYVSELINNKIIDLK